MNTNQQQYNMQSFNKGQIIFKEGNPANTAYLIKTGAVVIYRIVNNKEVVLNHLKPGQIFGEMGVIAGEPRVASAVADDFCELVVIDQATLNKALKESSQVIGAITKSLIKRLTKMTKEVSCNPVKNSFLSTCGLINFVFASRSNDAGADSTTTQRGNAEDPGIPYNELCTHIKEILCISQVEIDNIIRKLKSINLVEITDVKVISRNLLDRMYREYIPEKTKFIKLTDPKTFMKIASQFHEEHEDSLGLEMQKQEFIDIHDFARLVNTNPDLIYKKIAAGEVPENIFFIHRREALRWSKEMGELFFKKVKRRSLNLDELTDVNDIVFVDNGTIQDALSKLGPYKVAVLASIAGDEAAEKIYSNLSTKMAAIVREQASGRGASDDAEAGDIEKELITIIKALKGVSS